MEHARRAANNTKKSEMSHGASKNPLIIEDAAKMKELCPYLVIAGRVKGRGESWAASSGEIFSCTQESRDFARQDAVKQARNIHADILYLSPVEESGCMVSLASQMGIAYRWKNKRAQKKGGGLIL